MTQRYDLTKDIEEKNNIYSPDNILVKQFNDLIVARLKEISEFVANRDQENFWILGYILAHDSF